MEDTEKMTVTFADGSTKEIDVGTDGIVVNPAIPTETINLETAPDIAIENTEADTNTEIKTQENTGEQSA